MILVFGFAGCYAFPFLDQWRSITSNRFVLNMVHSHHLQLRSCHAHPCSIIFWLFNVKAAAAHYLIIQKEIDELLAKGVIGQFPGGVGFYSSVFAVPKCTGGLWPILNLKQLNCYLPIPPFKMPTIRHVWQRIQWVIMLSPLISRMLTYIFILLSIIVVFCNLFGAMCDISGRFLSFELATTSRIFKALT